MKPRSIKLSRDLEDALTSYAHARGTTSSSVVREALTQFLDTQTAPQSGSLTFSVLAADLAGCTQGPVDLASNRQHLADYGAVSNRVVRRPSGRGLPRGK